MNFTVITVDQRSPEWFAARLGRLTGSRAGKAFALTQGGKVAASRQTVKLEMVLERLTGKPPQENFQSDAMKQGIEREPDAFRAYEAETGRLCTRVGFIQHNTLMAGVSPDGVCGDYEGIVELKCPQPPAHLEFLQSEKILPAYRWQMIHSLYITGAAWCDLASWSPDFPAGLQLKIVRLERDPKEIDAYALAVALFLSEVDRELESVTKLMEVASAV